MSKTRMAGEALKDPNYEARKRLSENAETAAARAAKVGDAYDVSGYSDKEISMALQGDSFLDDDFARLTGKAVKKNEPAAAPAPAPSASAPTPAPAPEERPSVVMPSPQEPVSVRPLPVPRPSSPTPMFGGQQQNITQDNDITNTIVGDNNEVSNFQDNSISQSMGSSDYSTRYARGLKDQYVLNLLNRW